MEYTDLAVFAVSAWRYSAAYLLAGGGVIGAIFVFFGAKALGK